MGSIYTIKEVHIYDFIGPPDPTRSVHLNFLIESIMASSLNFFTCESLQLGQRTSVY